MNNMSLLVSVWETVAKNTQLSAFVTPRDIEMFKTRASAEGLTYLTITLPKLGKALDAAFQSGIFVLPAEFGSRKGEVYPMFLRRAFSSLCHSDGRLIPWYDGIATITDSDEYAGAALAIRQLTLMFYKMKLPYSKDLIKATIDRFRATDRALESTDQLIQKGSSLLTRASVFVRRLLHTVDPYEVRPRHGSGASACGTKPWLRYAKPRYFAQIDRVYPYTEYYYTSIDDWVQIYPDLFEESEEVVPTAKVVLVPKDSRGPRLISEEPRETMFIQQGQMAKLYDIVEHYPNVRAQLSMTDQDRNRIAAMYGSILGHIASIDLSDASDRVSWELVKSLFPENWVEALWATRSPQTKLPGGEIFPLRKFAPMGSACCFPVEAIVFWALSHAAIGTNDADLNALFALKSPCEPAFDQAVRVFGDDIIVPSSKATTVIEALESVGLKVNRDKSYTQGPFRESCGGDYLYGRDVAPVRCGHLPILDGKRNNVYFSKFRLCDWMNNLIHKYGVHLTSTLQRIYRDAYGTKIDIVDYDRNYSCKPPGLYLFGSASDVRKSRMCPNLQKKQFKTMQELVVNLDVDIDDRCHLLRWHLHAYPERSIAEVSLPKRHRYQLGWTSYR